MGATRFASDGEGHVIQDESVDVPQQPNLNFLGAGVSAVDNPATNSTNVTIAGGAGSGHVIQDEGTPLATRSNLNFVGAGVTATDGGAGPDSTIITIPGGGGSAYNTIEDEGTPVAQETVMNFVGSGVTATPGAGETTITIPGGINQAYQTIEDEGTPLAQETVMNFTGAGVVASAGAGETTITIPGAGGAGGQAYNTVEEEGTPVAQETVLNFVGAGVTATAGAGETVITIPGGSGGYDTIEEEGTPVAQEDTINFVGAGITASAGTGKTTVSVPLSASSTTALTNKTIDGDLNTIIDIDEMSLKVALGDAGTVLTSNGVGFDPSYQAPASGQVQSFVIAASDETTDLITGDAAITFRIPYGFTLTAVRASVNDAPTGALITVNIREGGVDILSTPITIDANELTSVTAAIPPVISDFSLADDAEMKIDIDTIGSTNAGKGLKVVLIGNPT